MKVRPHGWSLVELLAVLSIFAVVLGVAAPSLRDFVDRLRWQAAFGEAYDLTLEARVMAVQRNRPVTLCPSREGVVCVNEWQRDWLLFTDQNENGRLDDHDQLLRTIPRDSGGQLITWKSFRNEPFMQFSPEGLSNNTNGTLAFCAEDGRPGRDRKIVINRTGRARKVFAAADGRLSDCRI